MSNRDVGAGDRSTMMRVFAVLFFLLFLSMFFTFIYVGSQIASLFAFVAGALLVPAVCAVLDR